MHFQVRAAASWRMLIKNGRDAFKEQKLSILLKRTKVKR